MNDIEKKALELVNEMAQDVRYEPNDFEEERRDVFKAFCRAIERHEAFRQEVSDALLEFYGGYFNALGEPLNRFIIPPKPDPLVEAMIECGFGDSSNAADDIRAALAKRGGRIVFDD